MTEKIIARMNVMARRCSGWMLPACLLVASHIPLSAPPAQAACERITSWTIAHHAKHNEDLSGAACAPDGKCLLVSDEDRKAWWFKIDSSDASAPRLVVGKPFNLPKQGKNEADAEAAAFDDKWFYVIGSHGTSRQRNEFEQSRYSVYRIARKNGKFGKWKTSRSLSEFLSELPDLRGNFCSGKSSAGCKSLQDGGANIEGLAVHDGVMLVGFRAPAPGGRAFIVPVNAQAVFKGGAIASGPPVRVDLGTERGPWGERELGIRDLAAVSDGLLILAGPSLPEGDFESSGRIFRWSPEHQTATELCHIQLEQSGAKPEVLLKLSESEAEYRLLVLSDGVPGGAPVEYRLRK